MFSGIANTSPTKLWALVERKGGDIALLQQNTPIRADVEFDGGDGIKYLHVIAPKTGWGIARHFDYQVEPEPDPNDPDPPPPASNVNVVEVFVNGVSVFRQELP